MGKLNPKQAEILTDPGTYEDGDGLRLVVKPTGRKSWLLRFQLAGRRREMGLGSFPEVSLKKARQDASAKHSKLSDGIDPLATRDVERAAQREAQHTSEAKQLTSRHSRKSHARARHTNAVAWHGIRTHHATWLSLLISRLGR